MEQFVRQQNIAIFRRLLSTEPDMADARRQRIMTLLAAEEAKEASSWQRPPHDQVHGITSNAQNTTEIETG